MMRSAEKDYTAGGMDDITEMSLWALVGCEQGLSGILEQLTQPKRGTHLTSSQTNPPKLWQTNMIGRSFCRYQYALISAELDFLPCRRSLGRLREPLAGSPRGWRYDSATQPLSSRQHLHRIQM